MEYLLHICICYNGILSFSREILESFFQLTEEYNATDSHTICDCRDKENITQSVAQRSWVIW